MLQHGERAQIPRGKMSLYRSIVAGVMFAAGACAPAMVSEQDPGAGPIPALTTSEITAVEMRLRLSIIADDSMFGRRFGTKGNERATTYIASEFHRLGLEPAGESGSYFQDIRAVTGRRSNVNVSGSGGARNVIAIMRGSDPVLRNTFVAVGSHNDAIGIVSTDGSGPSGAPPDSIVNGADDDGSGTAALLEIAEAFAKNGTPPRRSILFVSHTGEEAGLLGSRWFTDHPTVERDSIIAQINIDMIGRGGANDISGGGPDYLQVIGARRLSQELGDIIDQVNSARSRPFRFDFTWDAAGHPEQIYCRSDHANYARYGIPVAFFWTGLHADYHQVTDEVRFIDFDHATRITQFLRDVIHRIADLDHRLQLDKPKSDITARCVQ